MSERPADIAPAREPVPRESASGIVLRRDRSGGWKVLLGLRSRKSTFMPGHLAFPGGRMEPSDEPGRADAHLRCVAREVAEETGLHVATERWIPAGERTTPPMFPRRFHTKFFVAEWAGKDEIPEASPCPEEIERLRLADPQGVLLDWSSGSCRVPPPVLPMLRALRGAERSSVARVAARLAEVNAGEERAPRIEFAPDIWMLPVRSATLPPATHTNVWMPGGSRFVIIDPGSAEAGEVGRLLEVVARRRKLGREPTAIVLTHHHLDHVEGCAPIANELDLPVRGHAATLEALPANARGLRLEPLRDGEELDLEGLRLRADHTPGHAAGHLAFRVLERGELLVGDLISGLSTILIDPGSGDMGEYLESLRRVREQGCSILLPGHGPPLPAKALHALIHHRLEREGRIVARLGPRGVDLDEIAAGAYRDVPQMPPSLIRRQALSHLLLLERTGRARRLDPSGRTWASCSKGDA